MKSAPEWTGADRLEEELAYQRYLKTNSYVFYEVANSYDLTHSI